MAIVVIGGHTRNIGKTSVIASLIAATPELCWTAIKITQFGHGVCTANGEPCDCETADHPLAISEERDRASGTDTSRYLAAGAVRSVWVRTRQGDLASAMPGVRREIARAENVILESNSVLRFLQPDFYASVLDPNVQDFKASSLRYLDRADAILLPSTEPEPGAWPGVSAQLISHIPRFIVPPPSYVSAALCDLLREKMSDSGKKFPLGTKNSCT
jgi:hypothetical protein